MEPPLERTLLEWVIAHRRGIYYLCEKPIDRMPRVDERWFYPWTLAHRLLSRFASWRVVSAEACEWVWNCRNADGLWDLGSGAPRQPFGPFPLSESWRRLKNRIIDSTVEMLGLLVRRT